MTRLLQVGIIGASADRGWAKIAHVPAVQNLAGLELAGVVSGSQAKSEAAAQALGAKAGYADAFALFHDPNIDIVSICVKVPDHRELLLGALSAGKHVYCEWPLGRNRAEAEEMAAAADAAGVHVAIGLQARTSVAARRARELIQGGVVGRVLSAKIVSHTAAFGPTVDAGMAFAEQAENGVTLVTVQGAHTLDLAIAVLGNFDSLAALTTIQYPETCIDGVLTQRTTPDHLLVQARIAGGSAVSIETAGGRPPEEATYRFEVMGTTGSLALRGGGIPGFQASRLHLSVNGKPETLDEGEPAVLPDIAANVAGVYAALRNDIVFDTDTAPDFHHALRLHRLVDAVLSSTQTGTRTAPDVSKDWPLR